MTENHVWSIVLLAQMLFITSCEFERIIETTSEEWIAIVNIDGTNLQYICRGTETPYFVPDSENPEQELLMLDCGTHIDLMNTDGSNRRTVIDSVGTIHSFSDDRTKMLLNRDGDIYIANTDGTALQNLTNTPDVWERDPSFSPDNQRIVYSYSLNETDAYLIIKDLHTGQSIIIYEFDLDREYKKVSFTHCTFQNDNQAIYRLHFIDQSEEPQIQRYELHRFDTSTNSNEIIIDEMKVGSYVFSRILNQSLIKVENKTILLDMESLSNIHEFLNTSFSSIYSFSPNATYLTIGTLIYRINDSLEYNIDIEENDFNRNETRIVGITTRILS